MSETEKNTATGGEKNPARTRFILALIPLLLFLGLSYLFYTRLGIDASKVPSVLINKPAPVFALPPLEGSTLPGFNSKQLRAGKVSVVNIFASWCVPCRDEHPQFMQLAADAKLKARGLQIIGLNYKDKAANAQSFLKSLGNPYTHIGVDRNGRAAIDWGVYGVPETFVVRGDGTISYKFIGPISARALKQQLLPEIEKALQPVDKKS